MNLFEMELIELLRLILPVIIMLVVIYFLVLIAVFLDLWAGIRKAKAMEVLTTSEGLRRTVNKISKYFNMLFMVTIVDILQMLAITCINIQTGEHIPDVPLLTFLGAIFICVIELKSVYEKAEDKEREQIAQTAKILSKFIRDINNKELVSKIAEFLKQEENEDK